MILAEILSFALSVYLWIIIIYVAISWLTAFGVVNTGNPQAQQLVKLLSRAVDPVMKPLQKYIPPIGGIDITPIIVIIAIQVLDWMIWSILT
jgi:YggT family protein